MTPQPDLASSKYCLANPGSEYLVYLPDGGSVTVDLSASKEKMAVEWFHPDKRQSINANSIAGGGKRKFEPPFDGHAVLCLV